MKDVLAELIELSKICCRNTETKTIAAKVLEIYNLYDSQQVKLNEALNILNEIDIASDKGIHLSRNKRIKLKKILSKNKENKMFYITLKCKECNEISDVGCDGDNAMMCPCCRSVDSFEEVEDFRIGGKRYCDSCNELLTAQDPEEVDTCIACINKKMYQLRNERPKTGSKEDEDSDTKIDIIYDEAN